MRKSMLILFMSALIILPILTLNSLAADDKAILRGTPDIDGILDDIYTQSSSMTLTNIAFTSNGVGSNTTTDISGTTYLLYDDKNIYICAVVNDDDVISADENYLNTDENPWQNDNVELWIGEGSGIDKYKVSFDAFGKRIFGNPAHPKQDAITGAATITSTGFIIELTIPWIDGTPSKEFRCGFQANDLSSDGSVVASGFQYDWELGTDFVYTMSDKSVTVAEPVAAVATATVSSTEAASDATVISAPQTNDSSLSLILSGICLAMLSMSVYVYSKKNIGNHI